MATSEAPRRYDVIGDGYAHQRRADPRLALVIGDALGDARTVVNVGAGTGSYEPDDRLVVAVEPSPVMCAQRPGGTAPVLRAAAETLPFPDDAFDAATAILTVHHWQDRLAGYRELRRVARRIVVLTYDPVVHAQQWIVRDYLPEIAELDDRRGFSLEELCNGIEATSVTVLPVPWDCTDGFLMAYWRRPEAFSDPSVTARNSGPALIDPASLADGLARLQSDLASGRWHERNGHLLALETFDAGLRLVVSDRRPPQ